MSTAFLLVTCCKEQSRFDVLTQVIENIKQQAPELLYLLTVFDNASTYPGTKELLTSTFSHVFQADNNVGYWSAVHWWLTQHPTNQEFPPKYTYIIESDMMHYNFSKLWDAASFLERHSDVGSVRLHEYSVEDRYLFNKDAPQPNSKRNLWQSHMNRVTGNPVEIFAQDGDVWETTFLTQLPALNRYATLLDVFNELAKIGKFIEPVFQELYWQKYQKTGILDGGIFNCDLNPYDDPGVRGSWTSHEELAKLGYHPTRSAHIVPIDGYTVTKLV